MKGIAFFVATVFATVIVVFSAHNTKAVSVDLLVGKIETPLSLALLGACFLGMLAGGLLMIMLRGKKARQGK